MKLRAFGALIALAVAPATADAGPAARVTTDANDGPGSLRAALASGATNIVISPRVGTIVVTQTLQYTGTAPLSIRGSGQTIDGSGLINDAAPIFEVAKGADLSLDNLTFDAGGGNASGPYNRLNQGGGKGVFIDVPIDRTGTVSLRMTNVTVTGTGNHGVHVSDCTLNDDCGGGGGGGGEGSPASIDVRLVNVLIEDNGNGKQDADGFRVDDRGDGSITFFATNSAFIDNGADGIELDEGNVGNVEINVTNSLFDFNGEYCTVGPFDPADTSDPCNDDGEPDVDDAFDVDEAGPGSLLGRVSNLTVINNFDEGLDFDEEDGGGVELDVVNVFSENNEDEGVKVSEEDAGSNVVRLRRVITDGDLEFEEEDDGELVVEMVASFVGDDLQVQESGGGIADATVKGSTVDDEVQIEANDGNPATVDGFYRERGSRVGGLDFDGNIIVR